jgi:hypothetical protein
LQRLRANNKAEAKSTEEIDGLSFWVFFVGIYKDDRAQSAFYGQAAFISITIGLIIERQCINWLKNRFGCTYFRLQKYLELDQRREAIRYNWEQAPPVYNPKRYREHYFLNDFDQIEKRFGENTIQREPDRDEYGNKTIQDFLPYGVACRMQETINFTVQLDGRAPELALDGQSKELLDGGAYDYESIPALRDFKIRSLEKALEDNVDRKYKISLAKGMQLALENFIMLILMLSLIMKANLFSLVYLVFLIKFA